MGNDLVYLASASSQTEAGALRAYLDAHGIAVHVQGEHHSSLLGPLGAFAIELRLLVPERDLARARELLEVYYAAEPSFEALDAEAQAAAPAEADEEAEAAESPPISPARAGALAVFPGLGLGHTVTGAPGLGLGLMALELIGILAIAGGYLLPGLAAALGAVALDLLGATRRARQRQTPDLPTARLRSRPDRSLR